MSLWKQKEEFKTAKSLDREHFGKAFTVHGVSLHLGVDFLDEDLKYVVLILKQLLACSCSGLFLCHGLGVGWYET